MTLYYKLVFFILLVFSLHSCLSRLRKDEQPPEKAFRANKLHKGTFGYDLTFLKKYDSLIVLSDATNKSQVIVSPKLQGRVMTSTSTGRYGKSYGWINHELISSGQFEPHINVFGGEDRFWLGPEGGQFSVFFKKGNPFDFAHWQTPPSLDTESFQVVSKMIDRVTLQKDMHLQNYAGFDFYLKVERKIRLLSPTEIGQFLAYKTLDSLSMVGFESENKISNTGKLAWKKQSGLLSVWILGMFNPSQATTIVIPIKEGSERTLGQPVNDQYFGDIPDNRLDVQPDVIYFKGDGKFRSKIGISSKRAKSIFGSYDAKQGILTLVQFSMPENASDYVNSMWEIQKQPYAGDVVNSYNDGPVSPEGKPLGPFYELETSSPAAALDPGANLIHIHRTYHFEGPVNELDKLAQATLGVTLQEIVKALP
ncbi:hypothetical protein Q0590_17865 [Rhodocytophaga aerolata]|uniref:Lipoprotein n=1 Tax=Rhodocytophaga aerolata TaxID=455078 RepID=A0ABT8R7R8_9BACT|nr:DUF6786 family protein [Rhodocytophaga aerolata]MDO1448146.1 hypothetical protein [Rhodocytophaga aerolata]